jgi:hypothetical protein
MKKNFKNRRWAFCGCRVPLQNQNAQGIEVRVLSRTAFFAAGKKDTSGKPGPRRRRGCAQKNFYGFPGNLFSFTSLFLS